jgi:predicted permease
MQRKQFFSKEKKTWTEKKKKKKKKFECYFFKTKKKCALTFFFFFFFVYSFSHKLFFAVCFSCFTCKYLNLFGRQSYIYDRFHAQMFCVTIYTKEKIVYVYIFSFLILHAFFFLCFFLLVMRRKKKKKKRKISAREKERKKKCKRVFFILYVEIYKTLLV